MMTIRQMYDLAVKLGTQHDLRGAAAVKRKLQREQKKFERLPADQQAEYDRENLTNPYSDTRYYNADPDRPVQRILAGIDIETPELLLAKSLGEMGKPIDLILSHHPVGSALSALHEVMHLQAELLATYGVPINIAESLVKLRMSEVSRQVGSANHYRAIDAAKVLGFPIMCTHTATDNMVARFLQNFLDKHQQDIELVGDVVKLLKTIPEYRQAIEQKAGPVLYAGREDNFTGKIALTEVTGGTSGSKDMYERMATAGVGTIIGMHMHEEHKKEAEKNHINVIIAGHMSSDSLGMNLFLDELEKRGVEIVPCSGLIRISRNKKSAPRPSRKRPATKRRR